MVRSPQACLARGKGAPRVATRACPSHCAQASPARMEKRTTTEQFNLNWVGERWCRGQRDRGDRELAKRSRRSRARKEIEAIESTQRDRGDREHAKGRKKGVHARWSQRTSFNSPAKRGGGRAVGCTTLEQPALLWHPTATRGPVRKRVFQMRPLLVVTLPSMPFWWWQLKHEEARRLHQHQWWYLQW